MPRAGTGVPIDPREVRRIARLACLELGDDEIERFGSQLRSILAYVARIAELDRAGTADGDGEALAPELPSRLREDVVEPCLGAEVATRSAPRSADGLFRVPNVLRADEGGDG